MGSEQKCDITKVTSVTKATSVIKVTRRSGVVVSVSGRLAQVIDDLLDLEAAINNTRFNTKVNVNCAGGEVKTNLELNI